MSRKTPIANEGSAVTNISHLSKSLMAFTVVTSVLVPSATEAIAQMAPPNLPAAIICYAQADQSWRVGYLFRVKKDGEAVYISPEGKLTASVNAKGLVEAPVNRPAGLDCYGKTLDELRASNRTMEFQRLK
jgi:hypothetical protein